LPTSFYIILVLHFFGLFHISSTIFRYIN
jgi:hypothetical protein